MNDQISFRLDKETIKKLKEKLKKESKNMTLFFRNLIKEYLEKP